MDQWLEEKEIGCSSDKKPGLESSAGNSLEHSVSVRNSCNDAGAGIATDGDDACDGKYEDAALADVSSPKEEEAKESVAGDGCVTPEGRTERGCEGEEGYEYINSEVPASEHSFHITSLSVFKTSPVVKLSTANTTLPTKTTAAATSATATAATDAESRAKATDQVSCSMVVTGLTKTIVESCRRRRTHMPMLIIHVLEETRQQPTLPHKATATGGDSTPTVQQQIYMAHMQAVGGSLDLSDILPNIVNPLEFAPESSVMLNLVGVVPLREMSCHVESGYMPEISQIVPLDRGNLLAVTCRTLDKSDNHPCTSLLLYRLTSEQKIEANPVSTMTIRSSELWICPVADSNFANADDDTDGGDDDGSSKSESGNDLQKERVLLASLSSCGDVMLYDCIGGVLEELGHTQCMSPGEGEERTHGEDFTHCAYCPTTCQLFVSTRSGKVLSLRVQAKTVDEGARGRSGEGMDTSDGSDSAIDWSLDEEDLDNLLSLVRTAPRGVPFTCSCPVDWKTISLEQVNRKSPLHVNPPPEQKQGPVTSSTAAHNEIRWNYDNSVILQYEPPLEPVLPNRSVSNYLWGFLYNYFYWLLALLVFLLLG